MEEVLYAPELPVWKSSRENWLCTCEVDEILEKEKNSPWRKYWGQKKNHPPPTHQECAQWTFLVFIFHNNWTSQWDLLCQWTVQEYYKKC